MKKNASKRIEGTSPGRLRPLLRIAALGCAATALAAEAHVKWFAPYIVGAPPQPLSATLTNQWFWIGIARHCHGND